MPTKKKKNRQNMDAIHPDTAKMFKASKFPMVQMIGAGTHHKVC